MQTYQCLEEHNKGVQNPAKRAFADYWLNTNLSGFSFSNRTGDARQITMLGDGNDGHDLTDARYNLPSLPTAWFNDQNSPTYHHAVMANYAFLDGHVKTLAPEMFTNESTDKGAPTFAVK
jgi:prepilin-type processing-associated H-X9-DG protein